ncbi:MAG: asparaginase [Calditrichia bacterium]|nr:asparaginase [Calditrichia bacterium]
MKKILLIHTGGTFGMMPLQPSQALAPADIQELILKYLPEIRSIAQIDFEVAFNIDSSNIQVEHWKKLGRLIKQKYQQYDGFVIIHGTDAMVYSASALSFMLQGLDKPVILTGSQRPLAVIRSDARSNLINSIELATRNIPEVGIFFGTNLYRGNRAIKISNTSYKAFASPNNPALAEVGLDITLSKYILQPGSSFRYQDSFDDHVLCFRFHPGLSPKYLESFTDSPLRGIVIEALGVGNVSILTNSLIPWIERMTKAEKIVVINSQSPYGKVDLSRYECGHQIEAAGGISGLDMTTACCLIKLMFLFGQNPSDISKLKQGFLEPLAGELSQ